MKECFFVKNFFGSNRSSRSADVCLSVCLYIQAKLVYSSQSSSFELREHSESTVRAIKQSGSTEKALRENSESSQGAVEKHWEITKRELREQSESESLQSEPKILRLVLFFLRTSLPLSCQFQRTGKCIYRFKGLVSTAGYCKFSAWKRETEIPRQAFSKLILSSLASQTPGR